ncbi:hypothetical protein RB25_23760 [Herbaspirillum rubrisubalbicans]|uniref:Uncharacterized protein n=1 Tax=Herbaspirillum rubrisubalbicans TaxID=80842 RepID=A0ABX9BWF7_9BURK|nr:hypothetical protein [Herbaspirillum rubrisubalbicans]RAM62005.1 hypothetical protein RB24_22720 [Herbaspirillum rubrisubalbicans]RAN43268.1 hypothetical protein RB25_23760 [Herbaspirillum rubrisubalbicans]
MYYLIIWDKALAASGRDGCLSRLEIPMDLAKYFFQLEERRFPILSQLSFDDYDLFSGSQLESLIHELQRASNINLLAADHLNAMVKLIWDAKSLDQSVLFDPFRSD